MSFQPSPSFLSLSSHSHLLSNQATSQSVDAVERQSFMNSVEGLVGLYVLTREEGAAPAGRSRTRKKQAPFCLSKKNKRTIIFRPRLGSARRASSIPYLYLLSILSSVNPLFPRRGRYITPAAFNLASRCTLNAHPAIACSIIIATIFNINFGAFTRRIMDILICKSSSFQVVGDCKSNIS